MIYDNFPVMHVSPIKYYSSAKKYSRSSPSSLKQCGFVDSIEVSLH